MTSDTKITFGESVKLLGKALRVSLKVKSPFSLVIELFGFVMAFWPVLTSKQLQRLTDEIVSLFGSSADTRPVVMTFLVLLVLLLGQFFYNSVKAYFMDADAQSTLGYIRQTIIRLACRLRYKYIESSDDFKQKADFAQTDTGSRVAESIQSLTAIAQRMITFVSVAVVLGDLNIWLVVILVVSCIPGGIIAVRFQEEQYYQKTFKMMDMSLSMGLFSYCFRPWRAKEIRYFGLYHYLKNLWMEKSMSYIKTKNQLRGKFAAINFAADILRNSVYIGVLLLVGRQIYQNPAIGLGSFMLVFTLSSQFQEAVTDIFVRVSRFAEDVHYIRDFFSLEELEFEPYEKSAAPMDSMDIRFENVSFSYPDSAYKALDGFNVTIRQGEKIAIVGENGSGKTTFVSLLMGLFDPDEGMITANERNTREILTVVRRSISAVFQDFGRYDSTLRENICMSERHKSCDDAELARIATQTGAYEFIKTQPDGFDEMIGAFSKKGNNLSGGQWQKLALTRALYRDRGCMMILDEPTAALDPLAEAQLYKDFSALTGDKTTLLISHRLGITSVVDRILVFQNGKIVEDGSHAMLMEKSGVYAAMYQAQAQWYQ